MTKKDIWICGAWLVLGPPVGWLLVRSVVALWIGLGMPVQVERPLFIVTISFALTVWVLTPVFRAVEGWWWFLGKEDKESA